MRKKKLTNNTTFIVEVKSTQHKTWQGVVSWVEENKKENFRSALELIKLLDSAIGQEEENNETIKTM